MDLFYKPPMERPDECAALEENYMNCLFQKAFRDRVINNRCVMDSILWFHLECPKAASKFDDPNAFKRKVRDFISEAKTAMEASVISDEATDRVEQEYAYMAYPEDIKPHKELRQFQDVFDQYSPVIKPDTEDEWEEEDEPFDNVDPKEAKYGNIPNIFKPKPLKVEDSLKQRPQ